MKRYIIGGIAGFLLATAVSAHAAEIQSVIGKTIEGAFPIKIDGKPLATPAIVVDGTSYLPVRSFSQSTGYEVTFDADMGITLTKKGETAAEPQPSPPAAAPAPTPALPAPGDLKAGYKAISSCVLSMSGMDKAKKSKGDFSYIQVDGQQYVSLITLGTFYTMTWIDPMMEFKLDDKLVTSLPIGKEYSKGIGTFNYEGVVYADLSLLGLKGIVNGDTLTLTEL